MAFAIPTEPIPASGGFTKMRHTGKYREFKNDYNNKRQSKLTNAFSDKWAIDAIAASKSRRWK